MKSRLLFTLLGCSISHGVAASLAEVPLASSELFMSALHYVADTRFEPSPEPYRPAIDGTGAGGSGWTTDVSIRTDVVQDSRPHWLFSHLQFSGDTSLDREGASRRLNLTSSGLIFASHSLGLNFSSSVSHRARQEQQSLGVSYVFPLGDQVISLSLKNSDYENPLSGDTGRIDASGRQRILKVSGSRPLFSWHGVRFDGVFSHSDRNSDLFEDTQWVENSSRQLSTLGVRGSTSRYLVADVRMSTSISATSGLDYEGVDYGFEGEEREDRFHKLQVATTFSRSILNWHFGVGGRYQIAPATLPSSEHLVVAGPSLISGWNGQSISAAEGGWVRLDARSPSWELPVIHPLRTSLQLSVLRGWMPLDNDDSRNYGRASAGQFALQLQGQDFRAHVSVARMLEASSVAATIPDYPDVSLSLSVDI